MRNFISDPCSRTLSRFSAKKAFAKLSNSASTPPYKEQSYKRRADNAAHESDSGTADGHSFNIAI